MAYQVIYLQKLNTGQVREAPVGFSWTTLIFGPFPMLFRGNWKLFVFVLLPAVMTLGLSDIVFAFIINKLHIKDLLRDGFMPKQEQLGSVKTLLSTDVLLYSMLAKHSNKRPEPVETEDKLYAIISKGGSIKDLQLLYTGKSPEQIATSISSPDSSEHYPLHSAIQNKRLDLAGWLLEAGADPSTKNYWGNTAVDIARKNNDEEALSLLARHTQTANTT